MSETAFTEGDPVLFIDRKHREAYDVLEAEKTTNIRGDLLAHDEILGREEGFVLQSQRGSPYHVFRPTLAEHVRLMPRGAQIIYPKDIGAILVYTDIYPGAKVVECGLGSGSLTSFLLRAVGPSGSVTSYEIRDDFINNATKNLNHAVPQRENHAIRRVDIYESFEDTDVDRLILDVPEPWQAITRAAPHLRPGAIVCSYSPTVLQVHEYVRALKRLRGFMQVKTIEVLRRHWKVEEISMRPEMRMVAHTAFLTFARRVGAAEPRKPTEGGAAQA